MLHFVHASLDERKPHAVLAAFFDLSMAYNRVAHSLVIQDLFDMKTPALPAGIPQGAFLGDLIFIIKFNEAFLRPSIPRNSVMHRSKSEEVKYIDDLSAAVSKKKT